MESASPALSAVSGKWYPTTSRLPCFSSSRHSPFGNDFRPQASSSAMMTSAAIDVIVRPTAYEGGQGLRMAWVSGNDATRAPSACSWWKAWGGGARCRMGAVRALAGKRDVMMSRGDGSESGGGRRSRFSFYSSVSSVDGLRGEAHPCSSGSTDRGSSTRRKGCVYRGRGRGEGEGSGGHGIRRGSLQIGGLSVRGYIEREGGFGAFLNRARGSLPVIGLLSRIFTAEGGVGTDQIRFAEFSTRVAANSSWRLTQALYDMNALHGERAKSNHVLLWCWVTAIGAGLVKTEDILLGAARLRISNDLPYEIDNFDMLMDEGAKRRARSNAKPPKISLEARAAVALDAISKSCLGDEGMSERDAELLGVIIGDVFPSIDKAAIQAMITAQMADERLARENKQAMVKDGEEGSKSDTEEGNRSLGNGELSTAAA